MIEPAKPSATSPAKSPPPRSKTEKVYGAEIAFVETVKFQGQDVRVEYKGKVAGDEIKFTRTVAESQEMVAKRVK
jgi:hypothetical protein